MALLKGNIANQVSIIAGKYVLSGSCTDVIGGTMTAGSADSAGSNLITWSPAFVSAPMVFANAFSAASTTATIMPLAITGVTVSNCYVQCYASGGSMNIMCVGETRL